MNGVSSIYRLAPTGIGSDERTKSLMRDLWHKFGVAVIRLQDVPNDFDRQAITNVASRLYGKRG